MQEIPIITIGEMVVDMIYEGKDPAVLGDKFLAVPGGAPANVAVGVARLGMQPGFIGCVGQDRFGDNLVDVLRQNGVDTASIARTDEALTTLAYIFPRTDGQKSIFISRGGDRLLREKDIKAGYFKGIRILDFGSVSLSADSSYKAIMKAIRLTKANNALIAFDPNYRPAVWKNQIMAREKIWEGIRQADIVKASDEELPFITEEDTVEEATEKVLLAAPSVNVVIVTMAERGAYYKTRKRLNGYIPGFTVDAVEVTGAGDAFMASLLVSIYKRDVSGFTESDWREVLIRANGAGALAVTKKGAISAMPTLDELNQFIKNH